MRRFFLSASSLFMMMSCSDNQTTTVNRISAPENLAVEQISDNEVIFSWSDTSDEEIGFTIFLTDFTASSEPATVGITTEDTESYRINGLEPGNSYFLGVRADAADSRASSGTVEILYEHEALPVVEDETATKLTITDAEGYDSCIYIAYTLKNAVEGTECGLCWNETGNPTLDDSSQNSARIPSLDCSMTHVLANTLLDYGKTYVVRAYARSAEGVTYSNEVEVSLGKNIQPITMNWTLQDYPSLPEDVKVYKTTDKLNGGNFTAWYAIADVAKGNVGFKVLAPSSPVALDEQYASDESLCLLVNGGYFHYTGTEMIHAGYVITERYACATNVYSFPGSIKENDPQNKENYRITRGIFGVDSNQNPGVHWVGRNTTLGTIYYDNPLPSVVGEEKYYTLDYTNPSERVSWVPYYALSAGPVLLKDGKCPFDYITTEKGYYMANFELIAYDVYESSNSDRTAVGYTEDGKIIIFVCDGRMESATGATLKELAQIMKGLGCVDAVNMDGGGSTGLVIDGQFVNYQGHGVRAVMSTMGFYKLK